MMNIMFVSVPVCVCGEFGDSCSGHVSRDVQERLPQRAADSRHVYCLFLHRTHHVYRGNAQLCVHNESHQVQFVNNL